jgi:predicted dithiol-disulfide oxidoreductase (DUF899 family)
MTDTPQHQTTQAMPAVVDRETWLRKRTALLAREKAHTREGDAIAAARRRLPMTEVAPVELVGADGPTPLPEIFGGRSQLLVFKHMFHVGKPIEEQCEGCTINLFTFQEPVYLEARDITFVVFSEGPFDELVAFKEFMGYRIPWYSTYGVDEPAVLGGGSVSAYLRDGERVFQTYEATDRGTESMITSLQLLDLTVYGRQERWEDSPAGWPQDPTYSFWRKDGRPTAQWTRPGATPVGVPDARHCCGS